MHLPLVVPLAWYRDDALDEWAVGRLLERHETKEGADGGQTQVARPDAGPVRAGAIATAGGRKRHALAGCGSRWRWRCLVMNLLVDDYFDS